jgi:multidrug efflux pump subunit AcrA (membrane-fusion protein)
MRAEVDLPNPDGVLRDGMYGRAVISLEPPSDRMTIPATCLVEQDGAGKGIVLAVRDGVAKRLPIQIGRDDGLLVEVNGGLTESESIILQPSAAIRDGSLVKVQETAPGAGSEDHTQASAFPAPNPGRETSPPEPT